MDQPELPFDEDVTINVNCRSGCKTKDHATYAECLKAAAIQIGNLK